MNQKISVAVGYVGWTVDPSSPQTNRYGLNNVQNAYITQHISDRSE